MNKTIMEEASEIFVKNEELKKAINEIEPPHKNCGRCKRDMITVTDYNSDGDGATYEVMVEERID